MSHSQFHCIDLFILRHAWLNLWDKHMTTGRINQVSYKHCSDACCIFWTLGTASLLQQDIAHPRAAASPFSLAAEAQAPCHYHALAPRPPSVSVAAAGRQPAQSLQTGNISTAGRPSAARTATFLFYGMSTMTEPIPGGCWRRHALSAFKASCLLVLETSVGAEPRDAPTERSAHHRLRSCCRGNRVDRTHPGLPTRTLLRGRPVAKGLQPATGNTARGGEPPHCSGGTGRN
jgi:hypothetical protein